MNRSFVFIMAVLMLFCGCKRDGHSHSEGNAVYYWRTTFQLAEGERAFLRENEVRRMYVRYFDVVLRESKYEESMAVPNATIVFQDSVPEWVEVVPVVYITPTGMMEMGRNVEVYAKKLVKRIKAISRGNGVRFSEIQLDCDWAENTQSDFFAFCEAVRKLLKEDGITLSSTIRLHQLAQAAPPVDRGVLMVYNTGAIRKITTKNSIFDPDDIAPYLKDKRLADYSLPLDFAYPIFGWSVCFYGHNNEFKCLLRQTDFSDTTKFVKTGENLYSPADYGVRVGDIWFSKNDKIRVERPSVKDLEKVKRMVEKQYTRRHSHIIYHLDSAQLKNYSSHEIQDLYSCH